MKETFKKFAIITAIGATVVAIGVVIVKIVKGNQEK